MEIAFHCPNCLADLIYDESKSYTCCFCHTVFTAKNEVKELEGGYYVGDAWNDKVYHSYHCEDCGSDFIAKAGNAGCPICSSTSVKDNGGIVGAMPRRAIPFTHTRQEAQEMFLDYIRNNSAVGRTLATDENKELLHKVYVPVWLFTYEVVAHAKVTAMIRNKANESKTLFGINGTESIAEGISESLSAIRSSFSRFHSSKKSAAKEASGDQPSEHVTGGVLSWQGIPFDASGILPNNVINSLQPYDQSKMVLLNDKVLMDTPVLSITKDPISCMQEFMDRIKRWTRQMIMDAHSDSYDISYFQDKTDYPLGIGELVLFPIWYMKGEYMGRDFYYAMNGQNGEVEANIPMSKGSSKSNGITYQQYWDKSRCTALTDTHFEFNINDPSIEILDYSFFEKPKESRVTPEGRLDPISSSTERKSLDSVFETSSDSETPAEPKKSFSELNKEMGFTRKRDPDKKLTKEEELQREREMIARLAVAAKEAPKGDMAAASSVPSWAKAVTPPPSATQSAARPARTKKAGATKSSAAAAANKPLWEKTEEELAAEKDAQRAKPSSMASHMARGEEISPFAANPNLDASNMSLEDLDKMPPITDPSSLYMKVPDKYKTPSVEEEEKVFREQIAAASSHDDIEIPESYEIPMPKISTPKRTPAKKAAPKPVAEEEPVFEEPVVEEKPIFKKPVIEEPAEAFVEEADVNTDDEMMANITFSFNKKKPAMSGEEKPPTATSIPRQLERTPERESGMAIMNSEYEAGSLRHPEVQHEVDEGEPREILPTTHERASEYFVGSEADDLPLRYRPAAPLAHARSAMNIEVNDRVDLNPEDDENNRPLATRPPAPLARATEQGPSLEYLTEAPLDEEIHQMPSLESEGPRWGEMPEAKETPSWAKPQQESAFSRPAATSGSPRNRGRNFLSKDELRAAEEEALRRASTAPRNTGRPRTLAERRKLEEDGVLPRSEPAQYRQSSGPRTLANSTREDAEARAGSVSRASTGPRRLDKSGDEARAQADTVFRHGRPAEPENDAPALARPGAGRPGTAFRPAPSAEPKKKSNENVPIWERVPETDGPVPAWGSSAAYVDERPRGSLMKPKDQIIDVEKPRERPSLWGRDENPKEVLPGAALKEIEDEGRGVAREIAPRRTPSSIERPQQEDPAAREVEVRPRTYAQRRQMEEEERRRQIQSSFVNPEKAARTPLRRPALRPAERPREEVDESDTINKTFESKQFENKPSVVASLDMLPEPLGDESIHHLAKDTSIPALARGSDEIQDELAASEKRAERAIRGLPEFDPDGPSPFKPN